MLNPLQIATSGLIPFDVLSAATEGLLSNKKKTLTNWGGYYHHKNIMDARKAKKIKNQNLLILMG